MQKLGWCAALLLMILGGAGTWLVLRGPEAPVPPVLSFVAEEPPAAAPAEAVGPAAEPIGTRVFADPPAAPDPAAIAGLVLLPDGAPAAGAAVRHWAVGPSGLVAPAQGPPSALAGADGRFVIAGLAAGGRFDVTAESDGCAPALAPSVAAGVHGLRLQLGSGFAIAGSVRDLGGAPIAGAEVRYEHLTGRTLSVRRAATDAGGSYRLAGLPLPQAATLRQCRVRAAAPGFAAADVTFPPEGETFGSERVQDFVLSRGGVVAGRVVEAAGGAPVSGAEVVLWETAGPQGVQSEGGLRVRNAFGSRIRARAVADAEGRFRFTTLPLDPGVAFDGSLRKFVAGRPIVGGVVACAPGRAPAGVAVGAPVREGEEQTVEVRIPSAGAISGRVVDRAHRPIPGYRVFAQVPDDNVPGGGLVPGEPGTFGGSVVTDAEGRFVHDRVPCPPDLAVPVRLTLCGCDLGLPAEKIVDLRAQSGRSVEAGDLVVPVDASVAWSGVVVEEDGRTPVAGAVLRAAGGASAISDAGGAFAVDVRAIAGNPALPALVVTAPGFVEAVFAGVDRIPRGSIPLARALFVQGRLLDSQGRPIPGSVVALMGKNLPAPSGAGSKSLATWAATDATGEWFAGGLRPGEYRISARIPGRTGLVPDLGTVPAGSTDVVVRIPGAAPSATLAVDVVDAASGRAFERGAKAELLGGPKPLTAAAEPARPGRLVFSGIEPGRYTLRVDAPGAAPVEVPDVVLDPARPADALVVRVGGGATLAGVLRLPSGLPVGSGFRVEVRSEDRSGARAEVLTLGDGAYELRGLLPGRWCADVCRGPARSPHVAAAPRAFVVGGTETVRADFDLVEASMLSVTLAREGDVDAGVRKVADPAAVAGLSEAMRTHASSSGNLPGRPAPAVWCRLRDASGRIRREERGFHVRIGPVAFQVPAGDYVLEVFDGTTSLASTTLSAPGERVVRYR